MELNGDKIVELIGLPDYDDRVLDLLEALGEDRDTIDDNYERTEEKYGIILDFDYSKLNKKQKSDSSGAKFLNSIEFYYNFKKLPFGLDDTDSYDIVVQKLGKEADFISTDKDDASHRYWFFKERGYLIWMTFEDDKLNEIYNLIVRTYEKPIKYGLGLLEYGITPHISKKEK